MSATPHPAVAVLPATFDPITFGHLDIIERASRLFERVVVGVAAERAKQLLFTVEERVQMIEEAVTAAGLMNVRVRPYHRLTVDLAREEGARVIVRGLRAISDFEWELQLASMNQQLAPEIETVLLMASSRYSFLSSTIVREIAKYGGDVQEFIPPAVARRLAERLRGAAAVEIRGPARPDAFA